MNSFDLLNWETETPGDSGGAIDAIHVLPFRGRSALEFQLRRVRSSADENIVFFREAGFQNQWNFALLHEASYDDDLVGTPINWRDSLDLSNPKFFSNCLNWNSFGRIFHFQNGELPVKGRWRASLGASGEGVWLDLNASPDQKLPPFTPFRWHPKPCAAQLWDWEVGALKTHFLDLARDSSHDVGFALEWAEKPAKERQKPIPVVENGTLESARELLTAALRSEESLWKSVSQATWTIHSARGASQTFLQHGETAHEFQLSPRLASLRATIFAFFGPHDDPIALQHACVRCDASTRLFQISCDTPTMHEILDAGWELRQWLKDKVAKSYVDELLPLR